MTRYPGIQRLSAGKYRVRVRTRDPKTGRETDVKKVINAASIADALDQQQQMRRGVDLDEKKVNRLTLGAYALSWLSTRQSTLKASTRDKYATILDLHILPEFEDQFIDSLTPANICKWRDKQKAKPSTINTRLRLFRTLLSDAQADLGLTQNAASRVRALRERKPSESDPNRLTAEELKRVLLHLRENEPSWYAIFLTCALTGARFGEISALRWEDIDDQNGLIHIRRAHWRGVVDTTKTGSIRTVALPTELVEVLREHRQKLVESQSPGLSSGWVFLSNAGTLLLGSSLRKPLKRALEAVGIEQRFSVHGFRRTFNNLARQVTSGDVVRSLTGHSTERMTEHYSHIEQYEKQAAVANVVRLMEKSSEKTGTIAGTIDQNKKQAGKPKSLTGRNH